MACPQGKGPRIPSHEQHCISLLEYTKLTLPNMILTTRLEIYTKESMLYKMFPKIGACFSEQNK